MIIMASVAGSTERPIHSFMDLGRMCTVIERIGIYPYIVDDVLVIADKPIKAAFDPVGDFAVAVLNRQSQPEGS